jgi:DNA-directed RNA polymerase subunit RPC12/RpoP
MSTTRINLKTLLQHYNIEQLKRLTIMDPECDLLIEQRTAAQIITEINLKLKEKTSNSCPNCGSTGTECNGGECLTPVIGMNYVCQSCLTEW